MAIYVVYFPRVGKARNTADYAQQVLAGIKKELGAQPLASGASWDS